MSDPGRDLCARVPCGCAPGPSGRGRLTKSVTWRWLLPAFVRIRMASAAPRRVAPWLRRRRSSHMTDRPWVRPAPGDPRWGHAEGLQIGLAPLPGPRGLIRVYTPYLGHPHGRMVNYVAVEPIPAGTSERGFSELETSALDGEPGKRFWGADDPA